MAELTIGPIVNEIRGSVGSRTFSRNAYGPYVKDKLVQPFRNTPKQISRRNALKAAVTSWQSLNDIQRKDWGNWAKENPSRNSLGKQIILSGYNMFISAYMNKFTVNALGIPFQFVKDVIPAAPIGMVYGGLNNVTYALQWFQGNQWFHAALFLAPQRPISKGFVNPSELKFTNDTPAGGFLEYEVQTRNDLLGFPTFVKDPNLMSPIGIKVIDLRSGLASPLYIRKIQSINSGRIY